MLENILHYLPSFSKDLSKRLLLQNVTIDHIDCPEISLIDLARAVSTIDRYRLFLIDSIKIRSVGLKSLFMERLLIL